MIFVACILTVLIETPFLALFGFRKRDDILIIICANVVTNLCLNLALGLFLPWKLWLVLCLEGVAVAAEYFIYALAFGASLRLFFLTLAANVLSYGLGLLIF